MATSFESLQKIKLENIKASEIGKNLILKQIKDIRSNINFLDGETTTDQKTVSNNFPPVTESYCHTFYRICGLPVISTTGEFYNPGYLGSEDTADEKNRRTKIDNSQDYGLIDTERAREQICYDNIRNFNVSNSKYEYRLDMMRYPMPTCMMEPNLSDPFSIDFKQINTNYQDRVKFKKVAKILRPFKCVPSITNRINPVYNQICAPFLNENNAKILNNKLTSPYLEFVARIRFASDVKKTGNSELYNSLVEQMSDLGVLDQFQESINSFSDTEAYIFLQLFKSFVSICYQVKETRIANIKLGNEIYAKTVLSGEDIAVTNQQTNGEKSPLEQQISQKKKEKLLKDFILAQIPTGTQSVDGKALSNPINCMLNNTFISLVQGDSEKIDREIKELEQQKNNQLKLFNSINETSFYVLGEVNGLGLIDIMAIMMSFWLLPQNELLSMFDNPSFNRLYQETSLKNSYVENRKAQPTSAVVAIKDVIKSMDKSVLSLLMIASDIVESGNAQ